MIDGCSASIDRRPADILELGEPFGFAWDAEDDEEGSAEDAGPAVAVVADWEHEVLLQMSAERLDIRLATTR